MSDQSISLCKQNLIEVLNRQIVAIFEGKKKQPL